MRLKPSCEPELYKSLSGVLQGGFPLVAHGFPLTTADLATTKQKSQPVAVKPAELGAFVGIAPAKGFALVVKKASGSHRYMESNQINDRSGLIITEAKLQAADPPDAVGDAFPDLVRAREDKSKLLNLGLAGGHPAQGPRRGAKNSARSRRLQGTRVLLAQGEASRFFSVLAEYEKSRDVTCDRLYLETAEKILPDTKVNAAGSRE